MGFIWWFGFWYGVFSIGGLELGVFRHLGTTCFVSDELFPSGPWTGFYNYSPKDKHRMDLGLTFAAGKMTGNGNDDVGRFTIHGQYNAKSLECSWTKTYVGAHDVFYRGFREGKGIWGTWEIPQQSHGGFQIWPRGTREGEGHAESAEEPMTAETAVTATQTSAAS